MADDLHALDPWKGRQLQLDLPHLGPPNPGMIWIETPQSRQSTDDEPMAVIGNNMAGVLFALDARGAVHWVDEVELELGLVLFDGIDGLLAELRRQNPVGSA